MQKWVKEDEGPPLEELTAEELIKRMEARIAKYGAFSHRWVPLLFTKVQNAKELKRAFEFYYLGEMANKQRGGEFASKIYWACVRAGQVQRALRAFDDMRNRLWPSEKIIGKLIAYYGKRKSVKDIDTAWGLFEKRQLNPRPASYGVFVRALAQSGELERAQRVMDECKAKHGKADPDVYAGLAAAQWVKNPETVEQLAEEAKAEGVEWNRSMLKTIVAKRLATGDVDGATAAFEETLAKSKGWQELVQKFKDQAHLPEGWDRWLASLVSQCGRGNVPVQAVAQFVERVSVRRADKSVPEKVQKGLLWLEKKNQQAKEGGGEAPSGGEQSEGKEQEGEAAK